MCICALQQKRRSNVDNYDYVKASIASATNQVVISPHTLTEQRTHAQSRFLQGEYTGTVLASARKTLSWDSYSSSSVCVLFFL